MKTRTSSGNAERCVWTRVERRKSLFAESGTAVDYKPNCEGSGAWTSLLPKWCPWCGGKVEERPAKGGKA